MTVTNMFGFQRVIKTIERKFINKKAPPCGQLGILSSWLKGRVSQKRSQQGAGKVEDKKTQHVAIITSKKWPFYLPPGWQMSPFHLDKCIRLYFCCQTLFQTLENLGYCKTQIPLHPNRYSFKRAKCLFCQSIGTSLGETTVESRFQRL